MFSTNPLDWGVLLLYMAFLAAVWLRLRPSRSDALDFLVAGRRITLPALVATLVSTWYGGILGVGEYAYSYGVSNWLVFGVPYYVGALLFAWLIARRARAAELYTIPDLLERHYGRGTALAGAAAVFATSAPAAYVLMLGTLFAAMTGWALAPCILAAAVLSVFYVHRSGLRSDVLTDQVQFVLMYAGFAMLIVFLFLRHGALPLQPGAVPPQHFTWHGGNPPQTVLVWYVIALGTLVDPTFWQRMYAARDPVVARRAVLWSVAFWIVFDFMTTTAGLYARALLPDLADPVFAFPELARATLPPLALGFFYVGMIATVMSTVDSYTLIAGQTIGRDVMWRLRGGPGEEHLVRDTRIGMWASAAFAAVLAIARPSVVALWHDIGSVTTPVLLMPVVTALLGRGRIGSGATRASMLSAFAVTSSWIAAKDAPAPFGLGRYPWNLEPIYAGLAVSLAVYVFGWARGGMRERRSS